MKQKIAGLLMAGMLMMGGLTGCGADTSQPDDYATNEGYEVASSETTVKSEDGEGTESSVSDGISKEKIKVGVLYISDPAEGSGYSYTHDLGILGMQRIVNTLIENSGGTVEAMQHMQEVIKKQNQHIVSTEESVHEVMKEINTSIDNIRSIENKTRELEHARKEIVDVIERLSDIAQNNVASTQQTNSEINEVSEHFEDVEQSAANLRETATALEENIRNFKL